MTKHTPGPWEVVKHRHIDDELWLSVNQHADAEGMKEWIAEIKYLTTDPDRQWANARLIAAAPELLAALKQVVDEHGPWHDDDCPSDDTCDCSAKPLHDAINTAIKKAEG